MMPSVAKVRLTYAVVLSATVENIERIQDYLADLDGVELVYQRTSGGKLFIEEAEHG